MRRSWSKPGSSGCPPQKSNATSRTASIFFWPRLTRSPASASASAFCVTTLRLVRAMPLGSVPAGAFAMLQACPSTRIAASTTAAGSVSTAAGSTSVSGESGTPRSPIPTESWRLPVGRCCPSAGSKRR